MEGQTCARDARRWPGVVLWVLALLLMLAAASYQRRTGPTYPLKGAFEIGERRFAYELPRSESTASDARVALPDPGDGVSGRLWHKRYGTEDLFRAVPLESENGSLVAELPAQPPAGKLEYYVELRTARGEVRRIPARPGDDVVIRFRGDPPIAVLAAHVAFMFLSMLVGIRAGLAALFRPRDARRLAWVTLAGITVGGMVLGPLVQHYAFGKFWTGFPFGYDLTDNKTLIMWLGWLAACAVAARGSARRERATRVAVAAATLIMMVVYLIPHSLHGSTLDYEKLDQGVPAAEAVGTD